MNDDAPDRSVPQTGRSLSAATRRDDSYERLEEKLSSLAAAVGQWQRDLDGAANRASRLEGAFTVLLTSLEAWKSDLRDVAARTEGRVLRGLELIDSRIGRLQVTPPRPDDRRDPNELDDIRTALKALEKTVVQRMQAVEEDLARSQDYMSQESRQLSRLTEGLEFVDQRLQGIDQRVSTPEATLAPRLIEALRQLEQGVAGGLEQLDRRLQAIEQRQTGSPTEVPAKISESLSRLELRLRAIEERLSTDRTEPAEQLAERFAALESKVSEGQEQLNQKLEALDTHGATSRTAVQAGYSEGLGELKAEVLRAVSSLESRLVESLDTPRIQQIARNLEILDARTGHGYESLAKGMENAISALTTTLDDRTAAALEANVDSAERLWRGFKGLEEQIAESVGSASEAAESKASTLASIDELKGLIGARAGHTEKLMMEGMESLDGRFSENLLAVSEALSSALFGLNKAVADWRSSMTGSLEELEEKLLAQINQSRTELAGQVKAGLEVLGRREERMLALILGGGPATSSLAEPSEKPKKDRST